MKTIVIYKSKTGFTKKYAEWIAEKLKADIFELSKAPLNSLSSYNGIIYGGSLHAVGIDGLKRFRHSLKGLHDQRIAVFGVGASPSRPEIIDEVRNRNFPPEEQKHIRFFYMRGGFDFDKLPLIDKTLMLLLKLKLKRKKSSKLTSDEKGMLAAYAKPIDFTKKANIDGIISYFSARQKFSY